MPILRLVSNTTVSPAARARLLRDLSAAAADGLGKPPAKMMAFASHDPDLIFGGSTAPAGFLEVLCVGLPDREALEKLTASLTALLEEVLGVPAASLFVRYAELPPERFGVDGKLRG